jgi:DNA uptake protein ComE-like DNA-binding protein
MRSYVPVAIALLALGGAGGCVSKNQYKASLAEAEAAKVDLEKTRSQKTALEQQVKALKDQHAKVTADAEFMSAELQRIRDSRDKERSSIEGRIKELEQKIKDLSAQHRAVRQEYEEVKRHNETLKATVARYQKELKERQRAVTPPPTAAIPEGKPPVSRTPDLPPVPPATSGSAGSGGAAVSAPAPPKPGLALVNVNTASANDLVLFLGVTKDVAERVVSNRPYRIKGELVAKNVMPKATFDVIKDRITVAP